MPVGIGELVVMIGGDFTIHVAPRLNFSGSTTVEIVAEDVELLHAAPHTTPVSRPDEVAAGRHPVFCGSDCARG